ncbi:MAG: hypothetical protein ACYTG5_16735 [Planctomycetota bacterium]|jgi:hypothetical protein
MNKVAAYALLQIQAAKWRQHPYADLAKLVDSEPTTYEIEDAKGASYQLEVQAFWDSKGSENLRLLLSIDDGGLSAFKPMTESFIMAPNGSFVGE